MNSLSEILGTAERRMLLDYTESAAAFEHAGDKGEAREHALRKSLVKWLPDRYGVARGEIVDAAGERSGQTDLIIWDQSTTSPLLTLESGLITLPAEALLATVEVKSLLDDSAVAMVAQAQRALRGLRPYGGPWALSQREGRTADALFPSYFSTLFAYKTSIAATNWTDSELRRIRRKFQTEAVPTQWLDRVVVLDRGMLLPSDGRVANFDDESRVLGLWYFHLVNFLTRETERRKQFPWPLYERELGAQWVSVAPSLSDAPEPVAPSKSELKKWRRHSS